MPTRSTNSAASNNPAQRRPRSLPEQRERKLGPGTLRTPADTAGPSQQVPLPNAQAQSARSNAASFAPPNIARADSTNARVIDRDSISLPSPYNDDGTLLTSAP
jgi:hypothetical protein